MEESSGSEDDQKENSQDNAAKTVRNGSNQTGSKVKVKDATKYYPFL